MNKKAEKIIKDTISRLHFDFGEFPMSSMLVLLIEWEDGMEYYGATITGIESLEHELAHMYFGCSLVLETWRDTWIDEALVVWWLDRAELDDLDDDFESDIVSSRSPIDLAFDEAAYEEGAMVFKEVAKEIGGDHVFLPFLRDLHRRRAFHPFTTRQLIRDLTASHPQINWHRKFDRWVFHD